MEMKKINLVIVWIITRLLMETRMLIFLALWWLDYDKLWHLVINLIWLVTYHFKKWLSNYSFMCWQNALTTCEGFCNSYEGNISCCDKCKGHICSLAHGYNFYCPPLLSHFPAKLEAQVRSVWRLCIHWVEGECSYTQDQTGSTKESQFHTIQ